MNQLITTNNNEIRMTSKELCELINMFRKEEGNNTEKRHDHLLRDIDNEVKALENVGISTFPNFEETTYTDGTRNYRCYNLTEEAVLQMLNKESAVVRYKTQQYIKTLKEQLMAHALPIPQTNLLNVSYDPYNNYNFKQYLNKIKTKDIPEELQNFIQAHDSDKPKKRLAAYNVAKNALEELKYLVDKYWEKEMIQEELDALNKRIELQRTYISRSKLGQARKKNKKLEETIKHYELDSYDDYYYVDIHGFTVNCCYRAVNNQIKCTPAYEDWKDKAEVKMQSLPSLKEMGLNPYTPKKLDIYFYLKNESFDVSNCSKSFLDALEKRYKTECPNFNDKVFADVRVRKYFSYSDSFEDGYIVFGIKDLAEKEITDLIFEENEDLTFDENKGA